MVKRDIVETVYEYDKDGNVIKKTVTKTHEDDDETRYPITTPYCPQIWPPNTTPYNPITNPVITWGSTQTGDVVRTTTNTTENN